MSKIIVGNYNQDKGFYPLSQTSISGSQTSKKFHNLFCNQDDFTPEDLAHELEGRSIFYEYTKEKRGENPFEYRIDDKPTGIYRYSHLTEPGEVPTDSGADLCRNARKKA